MGVHEIGKVDSMPRVDMGGMGGMGNRGIKMRRLKAQTNAPVFHYVAVEGIGIGIDHADTASDSG